MLKHPISLSQFYQECESFLTIINPSDMKRNVLSYSYTKVINLIYNKFFSVAIMFLIFLVIKLININKLIKKIICKHKKSQLLPGRILPPVSRLRIIIGCKLRLTIRTRVNVLTPRWDQGNLIVPKFAIPSNIYDRAFLPSYQFSGLNPETFYLTEWLNVKVKVRHYYKTLL